MSAETVTPVVGPEVVVRGQVAPEAVDMAIAKVSAVCDAPPRPVLFVRVTLAHEPDPAHERPALATASIDLSGRVVRARAACSTMPEAIDLLADRIRRGMRRLHEEHRPAARRPGLPSPGEWRHGDLPSHPRRG